MINLTSILFLPKKRFFGKKFRENDEYFLSDSENDLQEQLIVMYVNCKSRREIIDLVVRYADEYRKKKPTEKNVYICTVLNMAAAILRKENCGAMIPHRLKASLAGTGLKIDSNTALYLPAESIDMEYAKSISREEMQKHNH